MKKRNIIIALIVILLIISIIIIGNLKKIEDNDSEKLEIVTSFYPIYIMTKNITKDIDDVEVKNMAENYAGCIHDYTLTTSDLKKFENADIFIENGYGIENFSEKIIDSYPNVKIIEASKTIEDTIQEENGEINAHFWTSIDNYILQVKEIKDTLKEIDTDNVDKYDQNAAEYIEKLEKLKEEYKSRLSNVEGKRTISLNESFSYLFKFIGIEEILISTDHEQSSLSAEVVRSVIDKINVENIDYIVIGENDDDQNATTIANETGAKIIRLNDCMSGDDNLDSYIDKMKENLEILRNI